MRCSPKNILFYFHTFDSMEWSPQLLSAPLEGFRLFLLCLCFDLENPWARWCGGGSAASSTAAPLWTGVRSVPCHMSSQLWHLAGSSGAASQ